MTDKLEAELAALKARNEEQEARIEELERKANPPAAPRFETQGPRGPTPTELAMSRASLSPEVMAEFVKAIPTEMVRGIVKSGGVGVLQSAGGTPTPTRVSAQNTSGWRDPGPLGPPPGLAIADRLMDVQDAKDRAERIIQHARMKAVEKKEGE
jgi:hypothetical protein